MSRIEREVLEAQEKTKLLQYYRQMLGIRRLEEASAKVRSGPPVDDEEDYALPIWAGVVPALTFPGTRATTPGAWSPL